MKTATYHPKRIVALSVIAFTALASRTRCGPEAPPAPQLSQPHAAQFNEKECPSHGGEQ